MTKRAKDGGEGQTQAPVIAGEVIPAARDARPVDLSTPRDGRRFHAQKMRAAHEGHSPVSELGVWTYASDGLRKWFETEAKLAEAQALAEEVRALRAEVAELSAQVRGERGESGIRAYPGGH